MRWLLLLLVGCATEAPRLRPCDCGGYLRQCVDEAYARQRHANTRDEMSGAFGAPPGRRANLQADLDVCNMNTQQCSYECRQ